MPLLHEALVPFAAILATFGGIWAIFGAVSVPFSAVLLLLHEALVPFAAILVTFGGIWAVFGAALVIFAGVSVIFAATKQSGTFSLPSNEAKCPKMAFFQPFFVTLLIAVLSVPPAALCFPCVFGPRGVAFSPLPSPGVAFGLRNGVKRTKISPTASVVPSEPFFHPEKGAKWGQLPVSLPVSPRVTSCHLVPPGCPCRR